MQLNSNNHVNMRVGHAEIRTFKKKTLRKKRKFPLQRDEPPQERINVHGIFPPDVKTTFRGD